MPEIRLENITKKFGDFVAVDDLTMVVDDGDFVTLLGPSGCGKTTTLRMIAGLETPTEGRIYIDDRLVFCSEEGINIPPDERDVGFLFQNYALWPHMTVYQNISFGLENMKWDEEAIEKRVNEVLQTLDIEEFSHRYPSELSGGQQQRVAIARTLAPGPKILFMDEPLSNLDAKLRMDMRTELKRLHTETQSTFVYVTHDQLEAMTLATKMCLLKDGALQQYEPPLDIYNRPINLFTADFVGNPTMNFIEVDVANNEKLTISLGDDRLYFVSEETKSTSLSGKIILGIRPEYVLINDEGYFTGKIYSTLPSGLETIVRIDFNGIILTSVVFGGVDFENDEEIRFDFSGDKSLLFDSETKETLIQGELKPIE